MGRSKLQIYGPNGEIYQPTLKLQSNTNPEKDAEELYQAMKGWEYDMITCVHLAQTIPFPDETSSKVDGNDIHTEYCMDL
ncbi:unnamed protein product [Schistosoma mattheei]|uniref:Uncharacterized protein n=1 Tax=Schistosoma mattheei TaxID=31246 RepID=A0A183PXH0_9TREM|nr:unnamed protein product [Schistosoma mattheei]